MYKFYSRTLPKIFAKFQKFFDNRTFEHCDKILLKNDQNKQRIILKYMFSQKFISQFYTCLAGQHLTPDFPSGPQWSEFQRPTVQTPAENASYGHF